jgi:tellurite methyltransferase
MAGPDRERWNAKYREEEAIAQPSPFLVALADLLPRRGRALDVAGGSGRNALWLLRHGLQVTIADISDVALQRAAAAAEGLRTVEVDLESEPLPEGPWEVIVCSHFLQRPLFSQFPALLAPGGFLVVAHPTVVNLQKHPRPGREYLLAEGELHALVKGLEVVRFEEGWVESGRHEARLVARKPL